MASRADREVAEKLKAQYQNEYPNREFRVLDKSSTRKVGRVIAERKGFTVIEDDGGPMVTAQVAAFDVLEIRKCADCGSEVLSAAIGEDSAAVCTHCRTARRERKEKRSRRRQTTSRQQVAESRARDRWEEPNR